MFRALNLQPLLGYLLVAWQFGLSWQGAPALETLGATGATIRRRALRGFEANPETRLEAGDVLVILCIPAAVAAAEERLLSGH